MNAWDVELLRTINQWPDAWAPFFLFLSKAIDTWWVRLALLGLVVALVWRKSTRRGILTAALGWPIANEATDVFKALIPFPRPPGLLEDVIIRNGVADTMGTASAHSANMMFVAVAFMLSYRWWGTPWLVLALGVGISRIYLGAHFPSQVLFGWAVGAVCAWGVHAAVGAVIRLREERARASQGDLPDEPPAEG